VHVASKTPDPKSSVASLFHDDDWHDPPKLSEIVTVPVGPVVLGTVNVTTY
jgi:hypothetical protein